MSEPTRPSICLVSDRRLVAPHARTVKAELKALERWLDEAFDADLDLIQIRERDLEGCDLLMLVRRLVSRRGARAPRLVVNDRADVALAADADGVHLRSNGPAVNDVRGLASGSAPWIVGRSVHGIAEIHEHGTADYLLFGTIFPGGSKGGAAPTQGLDGLARAAAASRAPLLAIGGVTPERSREVIAAGAAGIAAIGAFVSLGPSRAAKAFRAAFAS